MSARVLKVAILKGMCPNHGTVSGSMMGPKHIRFSRSGSYTGTLYRLWFISCPNLSFFTFEVVMIQPTSELLYKLNIRDEMYKYP